MSKNITVAGASYTGVPAVELPITGGGTASFVDITSTTATASDVASGKVFFAADGTQTTGTATGGGGGSGVEVTEEANATGTTCVITSSSMYQDYALSVVYSVSGLNAASSYDVSTDYASAETAVGVSE